MTASAPPAIIRPALAVVEMVDRRRRGIRPLRAGGILGLARTTYRGPAVVLRDGVRVAAGERLGELHLDNAAISRAAERGFALFPDIRRDLAALARWAAAQPEAERPIAFRGTGIVAPLARRVGFEIRPHGVPWRALESWYLRGLLVRWSEDHDRRLARGHRRLEASEAWISTVALRARYGQEGR
jgi:YkoP domain